MSNPNYILCAFALFLLPLFTGCGFMGTAYQKEADEEKKIIGYAQRYNLRANEVQQLLKKAGFNPGAADGVMGSKTRSAIRSFQKANELKVTGFINSKTWAKLTTYRLTENRSSVLIEPQNTFKEEAINETDISSIGKEAIQDEVIGYRLKSSDRIKNTQKALIAAGFDPGPIDGKMGTKTKKAIADFQEAHGLNCDGTVKSKTQEALDKYPLNQNIK